MCVPRLDLSRVSRLTREDITSDSAKTSNRSKWTDDKQSPRTPKTARLPWFQQQEMFTRENIKPGRPDISCDSDSDNDQSPRTPNTWNRSTEIYVDHKKKTRSSTSFSQSQIFERKNIKPGRPDISCDSDSDNDQSPRTPNTLIGSTEIYVTHNQTTPYSKCLKKRARPTRGDITPDGGSDITSDEGTTPRQSYISDIDAERTPGSLNPPHTFRSSIYSPTSDTSLISIHSENLTPRHQNITPDSSIYSTTSATSVLSNRSENLTPRHQNISANSGSDKGTTPRQSNRPSESESSSNGSERNGTTSRRLNSSCDSESTPFESSDDESERNETTPEDLNSKKFKKLNKRQRSF